MDELGLVPDLTYFLLQLQLNTPAEDTRCLSFAGEAQLSGRFHVQLELLADVRVFCEALRRSKCTASSSARSYAALPDWNRRWSTQARGLCR